MLFRRLALAWLILGGGVALSGHEIISTKLTWTEHVSRIFQQRCIRCHREGGAAPMPLTSYREARPWAKAIKLQVLTRRMPPWGPVKGYGAFRDDRSLSQEEIAVLSSWVEGGAPEGEPIYEKATPPEEEFAEAPKPATEAMAIAGAVKLDHAATVLGIEPAEAPEGGSIEVRAKLPSGEVKHLVWIRDYQPKWKRAFYYREPVELPRGSTVVAYPIGGVSADLLLQIPQGRN